MKNRKGFTLVELMVVILIVAILAAVAIPIMRGRINAAKWSEGKASAGTIATAIRALAAEKGDSGTTGTSIYADGGTPNLGFEQTDMDGTYFTNQCYAAKWAYDPNTGFLDFTVTVTSANSDYANYPKTPAQQILTVIASGAAKWSE